MPSTTPAGSVQAASASARASPKSAMRKPAVVVEQEVGRLDVAVDEAPPVGVVEARGRRRGRRPAPATATAAGRGRASTRRLPPLRNSVTRNGAAVLLAPVVDGHDVRVVEGGRGLGLGPEALEEHRVVGQRRVQQLDGHPALEHDVVGQEHDRGRAGADGREQPVAADRGRVRLALRRPQASRRRYRFGPLRPWHPDARRSGATWAMMSPWPGAGSTGPKLVHQPRRCVVGRRASSCSGFRTAQHRQRRHAAHHRPGHRAGDPAAGLARAAPEPGRHRPGARLPGRAGDRRAGAADLRPGGHRPGRRRHRATSRPGRPVRPGPEHGHLHPARGRRHRAVHARTATP